MKTPEQVLLEYGAGRISCFIGHRESYKDFEGCCEKFVRREFDIPRCCRIIFDQHFPVEIANGLLAAYMVQTRNAGILTEYTLRFRQEIYHRFGSFLNPMRMMRFDNLTEVRAEMPSVDDVHIRMEEGDIVTLTGTFEAYSIRAVREIYPRPNAVLRTALNIVLEDGEIVETTTGEFQAFVKEMTGGKFTKVLEYRGGREVLVESSETQAIMRVGTLVSCGITEVPKTP